MGITHLSGLEVAGVPTMGIGGAPFFTGNWYFVDALHGSDGNIGSADSPFATIYRGYQAAADNNNDVIVVVGSGTTSGTQRMSAALAASVDPTATTGTITWAKNACHLVGMTAPTQVNSRARFAPPTGTYTAATFGNAGNMFNVTGQGCLFANFSLFNGFSTGAAAQIAWKEAGGRNYYHNVDFGGMGDAASAADAGSRSIKISGNGENTFITCNFGLDTVSRGAANATVEFSGGVARNVFRDCTFPFETSASTPLGIIVSAASGIDRWQLFDRCLFLNNVQSGSTTMSGLSTLPASAGGMIMMKDCTLIGITEFGTDATSRGQIYVDGGAPTAATSGIGVNPT